MAELKQKKKMIIVTTCIISVITLLSTHQTSASAQEAMAGTSSAIATTAATVSANAVSSNDTSATAATSDATTAASATTPIYIGRGYVTDKSLQLRDQPIDKGFNEIETLNIGTIVNIIQETEGYYQIEIDSDGKVGFVDKNCIAIPDKDPTTYGLISASIIGCEKSSDNRNYNMALACSKINGLVLQPGEQFDWYGANGVGKANTANGFKPAPVIINKHSVMGVGGGVCQVCTTLYNVLLNLQVTPDEIHHHSIGSHYAAPGKDATVTYPGKDFKFTNPYSFPITIEAFTDGGNTVTVLCYSVNQSTTE